jgi:hypothetical protein
MNSIPKLFSKKVFSMETEYVLPVRKGGLGNQMFQVAAAIVYQEEKGKTVLIPREFYNSHNTQKQEYADTVFSSFPNRTNVSLDQDMIDKFLSWSFRQHSISPGFDAWAPEDISGNVLLHGYFQYYPSLEPHEKIIRETFLKGLRPLVSLRPSKDLVGIHIRRGDYMNYPHSEWLFTQPIAYYEKALDFFDKDSKTFCIFSDDLEWCMVQDVFKRLPHKIYMDERDECKSLALMTLCHGGFICANSTFSWWGAFLGAHDVREPVIVPMNWFKDELVRLFPKGWVILSV